MADAVRINMTTAVLLFIVFCLLCFQNSSGWIHNLKLQVSNLMFNYSDTLLKKANIYCVQVRKSIKF